VIANLTFTKKLASYSLLASAFIAQKSVAQILHTTVTPTDTVPNNGNLYYLDLNDDQISDFKIGASLFIQTGINSFGYPFGSRYFIASVKGSHDYEQVAVYKSSIAPYKSAIVFSSGQKIGSTAKWTQSALLRRDNFRYSYFSHSSAYAGQWNDKSNKFVGLRITDSVNNKTYYGWLRLSVFDLISTNRLLSPGFVIITDYAIQTTPNTPITAGDSGTVTSIQPTAADLIKLFVNNKVLNVHLPDPQYLNGNLLIYNDAGQQVLQQNISSENFTTSLASLSAGVYFVKLNNGKNQINRKIFVE
jgi:hypothetical protein